MFSGFRQFRLWCERNRTRKYHYVLVYGIGML